MELSEAVRGLRAHWWMPVVGAVLLGGAALGASFLLTPLYTSNMQFFVSTRDSTSNTEALQGSQFSEERVTSYARLLTGEALAGRVVNDLHLRTSATDLADRITATAEPQTVLIDVTVTEPDPEQAQRIARTLADEFIGQVANLEAPQAGGVSPVRVSLTQPPSLPTRPSSPQSVRNVVLGVLAGLVLGAASAVVRTRLDRRVRDTDEVAAIGAAAVIGLVVRDEAVAKDHVIGRGAASRIAEDYRKLRTNLQFVNIDDPPKVIMVSSAVPSEGKTTTVSNLALVLAEAGHRVTVVEADLRRPRVSSYLGLVGGVGLTNVLAGKAELDDVLQEYQREELRVLGSGPLAPNPSELLASSQMAAVLDKLRGSSDYVLVDAPPVLPVADSSGLAPHVDGVLLVVRYGSTTKEQLREAAATLAQVHAPVLGIVLNIVPPSAMTGSGYGYGYGYEGDTIGRHRH